MTCRNLLASLLCGSVSVAAPLRSGKASMEWISADGFEPGQPLLTGLRMVIDEGWHTYWLNPGEGGMKLAVKWELPPGWEVTEIAQPVPIRFKTGGLPGFGYVGTVLFPVRLLPPASATAETKLRAKVSWLTCNESLCVPGNADLELVIPRGSGNASSRAAEITGAWEKIPRPDGQAKLVVTETPATLRLRVSHDSPDDFDLGDAEIFPVTEQAIDPAATFKFAKDGDAWAAEVPKSEYASKPIEELTLVVSHKNPGLSGKAAFSMTWRKIPESR